MAQKKSPQKILKTLSVLILLICSVQACKKGKQDTSTPTPPVSEEHQLGFVSATSAELSGSELVPELLMGTLPSSFSLNMPVPGDQGWQGSCTSWSTGYATMSYYMNKVNGTNYGSNQNLCSPKYLYNQSKANPNDCQGGSSYPANFSTLMTRGICNLSDMPYTDNECSLQPSQVQHSAASFNKILKWERVDKNNITNIKTILYSGSPVLIAVTIDASFDNLQPPYIWNAKGGATRGGHAIVVVGYDDSKGAFKVQNSWGSGWKDKGHLWISYNFFPTAVNNSECYVVYPAITKVTDNLTNGLVLNMPINGNANDISGNNNNGTVYGAALVSDRKGNSNSAYQFNGYSNPNYIAVQSSTSLNFTTALSISVWLKVNGSNGSDIAGIQPADGITQISAQTILFKGLNGNSSYLTANHIQGATSIQVGASTSGVASKVSDQTGSWMHIVYTYSNNQLKMYKNGSLIWNTAYNFDIALGNQNPLYIGKANQPAFGGNGKPFNGIIDELRIYNRVLDESEVQKLYKL